MTLFAATHLSPWLTVVLASALFVAMAWYWTRLADSAVPPVRRRIRRMSLVFALFGVFAAALGFGVIDPDARPLPYVVAWFAAGLGLLSVIVLVMVDTFATFRMHQRDLAAMHRERNVALVRDLERRAAARRGERRQEGRESDA
ncbi:MAG: hypothetical protein SGJ11_00185 [Phycisphaerae bacterium]|nr:hypothetical protein [Phycisphaerae bacterium]